MIDETLYHEIEKRQARVLETLGEDVLILPAGQPPADVGRFRQQSDFSYLAGFPEAGAVCVFDPSREEDAVTLFVKEKNQRDEVWNGFTVGVKKGGECFPVGAAHGLAKLVETLAGRFRGRRVYYRAAPHHPQHERIQKLLTEQDAEVRAKGEVFDEIVRMRMIKSEWELQQMRRAIEITQEAHHACMRAGRRHRHEYQFEAEFEYACKMRGVLHFAFGTIVAAGAHGTCQHYVDNAGPVGENDLVLIDAGAAWNGYCADVTRTFPASGTFSPRQRDFYAVVLAAQKAGVERVAPGVRVRDLHDHAARVLVNGLKKLDILHGETDAIVEKEAYRDFWPAGLSHSLGLDVHDVIPKDFRGTNATETLQPGMVITVEPGFYSQDFNHQIPQECKGIGIRIEDDVLVTPDGHENLSAGVVKEIDDVERMVCEGG